VNENFTKGNNWDQTSFSTNFGGKLSFIVSLLFLGASTAATYIFSLLSPVQLLELLSILVHYMLSFAVSYPDLIKFPYFADTTERGDRGQSAGDRVVRDCDFYT
jgi:hypothetical protein